MLTCEELNIDADEGDTEMAEEVRTEINRILRSAGVTPEQARKMTLEELVDKFDENDGDAEDAEADQKHQALKNQKEGEAPYIAPTVPQKMEGWVISFATLPTISKAYLIGNKYVVGRPTAKDCILALQVAMAYPMVGKARRPMTLLLAWRMKDMLGELDSFCMSHGVMPRHETLQEAQIACAEHDTDVHGHNHPIDNLEVEDEEVSEVEKLKEEGNEFFVSKRYQKALTKYSQALQLDRQHAPLYSNRSICYLRLGCADKAIADADEAIRLKPEWQKPYARKAEALRAQGKLADVQKPYEDCIKQFKHNAYFQDALEG